jgi:YdaS antitoxin of YdaST toxin-antitoxin system
MTTESENKNCVERLIDCFGQGRGALSDAARALKVDRQVISGWKKRGWIPPEHALDVEAVSDGVVRAREVLEEARRVNPPKIKSRQVTA